MKWWHRLCWVLLGLFVVAGAIHAPLHEAEADCGPMSLCSGAVMLMAAAVAVALVLSQVVLRRQEPQPALLIRQGTKGPARGRAPPL